MTRGKLWAALARQLGLPGWTKVQRTIRSYAKMLPMVGTPKPCRGARRAQRRRYERTIMKAARRARA